jgi:hypothetical protein
MENDYPVAAQNWDVPPPYGAKSKKIRIEPPPTYTVTIIEVAPTITPETGQNNIINALAKSSARKKTKPTSPSENSEYDISRSRPHLCACERCCARCINCCLCLPNDVERRYPCPTTCSDLSDFRVRCGSDDEGYCLGLLCFPITLVMKLFKELPCCVYNCSRNTCKGTKELDYIP